MEILEVVRDIDELHQQIERCLTRGRADFEIDRIQYENKYLSFQGKKILGGMVITIADVTAAIDGEQKVLNSIIEGQEQERKRLAQEIHDGIGPMLSTIKMALANIESDLKESEPALLKKFEKTYAIIDEVANDLRSVSHNLMPKALADFGLVASIESLCDKVDHTKDLSVKFIDSMQEYRLEKLKEFGLYRIVQELINNTLRHAKARNITLQLIKRANTVQLMYEDDGQGFRQERFSYGLGLTNIESRAKALGGDVVIDSLPERGMTAAVEIPID